MLGVVSAGKRKLFLRLLAREFESQPGERWIRALAILAASMTGDRSEMIEMLEAEGETGKGMQYILADTSVRELHPLETRTLKELMEQGRYADLETRLKDAWQDGPSEWIRCGSRTMALVTVYLWIVLRRPSTPQPSSHDGTNHVARSE